MAIGIGLWLLGVTTLGLILRSYWREYRRDAWLFLSHTLAVLAQRMASRATRHNEAPVTRTTDTIRTHARVLPMRVKAT